MKRLIGTALVIALAFIVTSGLPGSVSEVQAGNGYEQWTDGWSDGCFYYWNGYDYTAVACGQTDGSFNFYYSDGYSWVYNFSAGVQVDGTVWLYIGGYYYTETPNYGATIWTISKPAFSSNTGYAVVDSIMGSLNGHVIDNATSPVCVEIVGNTCYVN